MTRTGDEWVVRSLEKLGATHAFGLPGTQTVGLFEALRQSSMRTVLATSELAAAFMSGGFGRVTGTPGVLLTMPGPGFAFALPGIAEARLDSVPLLHIVPGFDEEDDRKFQHQVIPQAGMAEPLAKAFLSVESTRDIEGAIAQGWRLAQVEEPGPVVVQISRAALDASTAEGSPPPGTPPFGGATRPAGEDVEGEVTETTISALATFLRDARRPVLFLGSGAAGAADSLRRLAEGLNAPVLTTPSGRGVLPEDHALSLPFDSARGGLDVVNQILADSDLVLALGCKMSHNGTAGFRLRFPARALVHVNPDPEALGANYPARMQLRVRGEELLGPLLQRLLDAPSRSEWSREGLERIRHRLSQAEPGGPPEPRVGGVPYRSVKDVIRALRAVLPRDGILTTDSGLHQLLVRRYYDVLSPSTLLIPSDFQSMGFGLPAAIGAKMAKPDREVVAVIGDGGLAMSGMEFLTLARESLAITVVVFHDGFLNLIRLQQESDYGHSHAVRLETPDMEAFADAVGAAFLRVGESPEDTFREAFRTDGPVLVEVPLGDTAAIRSRRRVAGAKAKARSLLGPTLLARLKVLMGRSP